MASAENLFSALPLRLQRIIDDVFDAEADVLNAPSEAIDSGGGFLVEGRPKLGGGGFMIDNEDESQQNHASHIKLSAIPRALELLNLPSNDDEVLSVFRNAASGWSTSQSAKIEDQNLGEGTVSREDWRSVCAVLLENEAEDVPEEPQNESDEYMEYGPQESEATDSVSDYEDDGPRDRGKVGTRRKARHRPSSESENAPTPERKAPPIRKLNQQQRQAAIDAFALFFPSISTSDVANQKILIKDIQRVAKLLGEKIKAEEMVDMIEAFSTSPDKSISFEDFGRIMLAANLI